MGRSAKSNSFFNLFRLFYKKRHSQKMLRIMRGYDILKKNGQLTLLDSINTALASTHIIDDKNLFSKKIFTGTHIDPELALRQYLLVILGGNKLNRAILYSVGNSGSYISHPLPKRWRNVLRAKGLAVSEIGSSMNLLLLAIKRFFFGIFLAGTKLIRGFKNVFSHAQRIEDYSYFEWLSASNLPDGTATSYDIISWYENRYENKTEVAQYCHGVKNARETRAVNHKKVVFQETPVPDLYNAKDILGFLWWCISCLLGCIAGLFRGHWWNALLLAEGVKAEMVTQTEPWYLAKEYMFNITGMMYRPLWTYPAEDKGRLITLYFYSTNCEAFREKDKIPDVSYMYKIMSWPNYLVWDQRQADFVREAVGTDANVRIVGPIWFTTSDEKMPSLPSSCIVVFDVQPVRDIYYQSLGLSFDYYLPEICSQFLIDIKDVLDKHNITVVHKRKRQIGKLAHYKYRNLLKKFSNNEQFIPIDSNISPQHIIKDCRAVISMPFTSTALIGRYMNKPSVYYDPSGWVQVNDPAAHGIQVISGKQALEQWVNQQFAVQPAYHQTISDTHA